MRLTDGATRDTLLVGDLSADEFRSRMNGRGLGVRIGPFDALLRSDVQAVMHPLHLLYRHHPLLEAGGVFSFHMKLRRIRPMRHMFGSWIRLTIDGRAPHEDHLEQHALAVLEWGMNLVIAFRSHCLLMLHAAVLEKNGGALIMPALPGDGKTTLCAALTARGWRLLSDEFGLVRPGTIDLLPLPRPMPLKNESIDILRSFADSAEFGPEISNTRKGTVVHMKPPEASVRQASVAATARWIVFPAWRSGAMLRFTKVPMIDAFMKVATNAFNYEMLGESGFSTIGALVEHVRSYALSYSKLDEAVDLLDSLAEAEVER